MVSKLTRSQLSWGDIIHRGCFLGTGNCDGAVNGTNGKPIQVPCQCPPNSTFFLSVRHKGIQALSVSFNRTCTGTQ